MFEDKRLSAALLMVWLSVVLYTFSHLGLFKTQFMSLGPSEQTYFMGVVLDTWGKWTLVAMFTFISTTINDFVGDSLVPFITNTIQDHKNHYLPYSKFTCWSITQTLSVYSCTMSIFSIYLLMSQLDFMLIRMLADSVVNIYTMHRFMRNKKVSRLKYKKQKTKTIAEIESEDESAETGTDSKTTANVDNYMPDTGYTEKPLHSSKSTHRKKKNAARIAKYVLAGTTKHKPWLSSSHRLRGSATETTREKHGEMCMDVLIPINGATDNEENVTGIATPRSV